jgi:hypothetical protein
MQRNSKLAILIILVAISIFVWIPKDKKTKNVLASNPLSTFDRTIPVIRVMPRKRTEFVNWGRDPFTFSKSEEKTGSISNLTLTAIIWNDKKPSAFINEALVSVGDKIADKTVKQIERNRVILTDGTNDYILELRE